MKRIVLVIAVSGMLVGCAYKPPVSVPVADKQFEVAVPYEAAWRNTVRALVDYGFTDVNDNFEAGMIVGESPDFALNAERWDCGSWGGAKVVKNYRSLHGRLTVRVTVDSAGESASLITVKPGKVRATRGTPPLSPEQNLETGPHAAAITCVSNGEVESEILQAIKAKVERGLSR